MQPLPALAAGRWTGNREPRERPHDLDPAPLLAAPGRGRPVGDGHGSARPGPAAAPARQSGPGFARNGGKGSRRPGARGCAGGRWRLAPAHRAARRAAGRHAGRGRDARIAGARRHRPGRPCRRPAGPGSSGRDRRRRRRPPRQHRDADPCARGPARERAGAGARALCPQRRAAAARPPRRRPSRRRRRVPGGRRSRPLRRSPSAPVSAR